MGKLFAARDPVKESREPTSQGPGHAEGLWHKVIRFGLGTGAEILLAFPLPSSSGLQDLVFGKLWSPLDFVIDDPVVRLALLTPIAYGR